MDEKSGKLSRRDFLKLGGMAFGSGVLGGVATERVMAATMQLKERSANKDITEYKNITLEPVTYQQIEEALSMVEGGEGAVKSPVYADYVSREAMYPTAKDYPARFILRVGPNGENDSAIYLHDDPDVKPDLTEFDKSGAKPLSGKLSSTNRMLMNTLGEAIRGMTQRFFVDNMVDPKGLTGWEYNTPVFFLPRTLDGMGVTLPVDEWSGEKVLFVGLVAGSNITQTINGEIEDVISDPHETGGFFRLRLK